VEQNIFTRTREVVPTPEALFAEIDAVIEAEADPVKRTYLYAAGMCAGDTGHAFAGRPLGSIEQAAADPEFASSDRAYSALGALGRGIGELRKRGHDVTVLAGQSLELSDRICGRYSSAQFSLVTEMLERGVTGPDGVLLAYMGPDFLDRAVSAKDERQDRYHAEQYLQALVEGPGIDVLEHSTPYRALAERIWDQEGVDPDYYGLTYYLSKAFAEAGNVVRAWELIDQMHEPEKRVTPLLAVAETAEDVRMRDRAEREAITHVRAHPRQMPQEPVELAEHFARTGRTDEALDWLRKPVDPEFIKADTWIRIYLQTGVLYARNSGYQHWKEDFSPNPKKSELVRQMAHKDMETEQVALEPRGMCGPVVPRIVSQIINATHGKLAEYRALPLAYLAEQAGKEGHGATLSAIVGAVHSQYFSAEDKVRILSAAAAGMQAAEAI